MSNSMIVGLNYITNPAFKEASLRGWEPVASSLIHLDNSGVLAGKECVKIKKRNVEFSGIKSNIFIEIPSSNYGDLFTFSAYVKVPENEASGEFVISILWFTEGKTYITSSDSLGQNLTSADDWTRLTVTAAMPDNAFYAQARVVQTNKGAAGASFLVDAVQFEIGSEASEFKDKLSLSEEKTLVNKALTRKSRIPASAGMDLRADIQLGDLVFNTVDSDGFVFVITDISGLLGTPAPERTDLTRGQYRDGEYFNLGRYSARQITLTGSILLSDPADITSAHNKLVIAADLVRKGAWLKLRDLKGKIRAMYVQLSGSVEASVANPNGKIDFSIGLKAPDPVLYEWNESRRDGFTVEEVYARNFSGTRVGKIDVGNKGNYPVGAVYDVKGPISSGATIYNLTNSESATFTGILRGERTFAISKKRLIDNVATLTFSSDHDLFFGDTVRVGLVDSIDITSFVRSAGNTSAVVSSADASLYSVGDSIVVYGVAADIDNTPYTVTNVNSSSLVVSTNSNAAANITSLTDAYAENETNKLFNGERFVASNPNNRAIQYVVSSLYSVPLTNVGTSNLAQMRNVVYRDPDELRIDTLGNEILFNGSSADTRGLLTVLSDWVQLISGNNIIYLDNSSEPPIYVNSRSVSSSGVVTLKTHFKHGLRVGDNIQVESLDDRYVGPGKAKVLSISRNGNVLTATIDSPEFSTGDTVVLSSLSLDLDGVYTITSTDELSGDVYTISVNTESYRIEPDTLVDGVARKIFTVSDFAKEGDICTIWSPDFAEFSQGDTVYVSGVHEEIDGQFVILSIDDIEGSISYTTEFKVAAGRIGKTSAKSGAQIARRYAVESVTDYSFTYKMPAPTTTQTNQISGVIAYTNTSNVFEVSEYERSYNYITLTTKNPHNFVPGDVISVAGDVSDIAVMYGNPKSIVSYKLTGDIVELTTSAAHGFSIGDTIAVSGVDSGSSFVNINGSYEAIAGTSGTKITYKLTAAPKLSYKIVGKQLVSGVATLTTSESILFNTINEDGDPTLVTVSNVGSPFDGQDWTISNIDYRNNTFSFVLSGDDVPYSSVANGLASLTYDTTVEKSFVYKQFKISSWTLNNSANNLNDNSRGTYAHLIFTSAQTPIIGDTVEIFGANPYIDGFRKIIGKFTQTIDQTTLYVLTVEASMQNTKILNTATASKANNSANVVFNTPNHGLALGEKIRVLTTTANVINAGEYTVDGIKNANEFWVAGIHHSKGQNPSKGHGWYKILTDSYFVQAYQVAAVPAPTRNTFSYYKTGTNISKTSTNAVGKVYEVGDSRMRVYYRSGWIG